MQTRPKMPIKKGDVVKVLTGKDRGKQGKVIQVFPKLQRVVVEGVNAFQKHLRPRRENEPGQRVEFFSPLHMSNVKKVKEEPKAKKPAQVKAEKSVKTTKAAK
ncbi:MAG: 50S ribosomal protein L24 [Patescibacteria group bacterium]|jgi:large subunit ribosomal protein L24